MLKQVGEPALVFAQGGKLLLNLNGLKPRQLTQTNLENILSLHLGKTKLINQRGLGLITLPNNLNHLIDV